jgi:hypothetical protein
MSRLFLSRNIEDGNGRAGECDMDTQYKPGDFNCGCKPCESLHGNCSRGPCEPCPESAGSDCSRCANPPSSGTMFPAPASGAVMSERPAVYDEVKVPLLPPGKYVVGFRYDCDATAQVCEYHPPASACSPCSPSLLPTSSQPRSFLPTKPTCSSRQCQGPANVTAKILLPGSNCADITIE